MDSNLSHCSKVILYTCTGAEAGNTAHRHSHLGGRTAPNGTCSAGSLSLSARQARTPGIIGPRGPRSACSIQRRQARSTHQHLGGLPLRGGPAWWWRQLYPPLALSCFETAIAAEKKREREVFSKLFCLRVRVCALHEKEANRRGVGKPTTRPPSLRPTHARREGGV